MTTLPVYVKDNCCPKCGEIGAKTTYRVANPLFNTPDHPREYMERRCQNCAYVWCETPVDTKERNP